MATCLVLAFVETAANTTTLNATSIMQDNGTYPELIQDSVRTTVVGSKSVTTFYVYAPQSSNYILRFWLMGVKHADDTFSSYVFRIDEDTDTQIVKTGRGDWGAYKIDGAELTYLSEGRHELHLEGTLSDVPNAERVICKTSTSPFTENIFQSSTWLYDTYKSDHDYSNVQTVPTQQNTYRTINYCTTEHLSTTPPYYYTAELNKKVFYSFFRVEYYTAGQVVHFQTEEIGGIDHVLHVFSQYNSGQYHATASSHNDSGISYTYSVPRTGFYYVLLRSYSPDEYGTCNLSIDGTRYFENIPVCCSYTEIENPIAGDVYSCFAKSNTGDPLILLMAPTFNGAMVKYNDNYPFNFLTSDYNWNKNARIDGSLSQGQWLFTTSKSFPANEAYKFDIYTRCLHLGAESFSTDFPYYQSEDIMVSSYPSFNYNCISWAVGEWTTALWIDDSNNNLAAFDSLFYAYGYTRDGAMSENSSIDLWTKRDINGNRDFTHASIKNKQNDYAAGYAWESKLGAYYRVFHPRHSLIGDIYGHVEYYYKKRSNGGIVPPMPTLLNVELSNEEQEMIDYGILQTPAYMIDHFKVLYDKCQEEGLMRIAVNIDKYDSLEGYKDLLDYCIKNPSLWCNIYLNVCKQEPLAIKLLKDISFVEYPGLWYDIIKKLSERVFWTEGEKTICPMQAYAMMLVKTMLHCSEKKEAITSFDENSITFSTDPVIDVRTNGCELTILFNLKTDAHVSLTIGNIETRQLLNAIGGKDMEAGNHKISVTLPSTGIYSIGLNANGCVYKKKIYIK